MGLSIVELAPGEITPPGRGQGMTSSPVIEEFLESGYNAARIDQDADDKRKFATVASAVRNFLKNHEDVPVFMYTRKVNGENTLNLIRTDTDEGRKALEVARKGKSDGGDEGPDALDK